MKYAYPTKNLFAGSSLGNLFTFVQLDRETNICGVWSAPDNTYVLGKLNLEFYDGEEKIQPVTTTFEATRQSTRYSFGKIEIQKRASLNYYSITEVPDAARPSVKLDVTFLNGSDEKSALKVLIDLVFPAIKSGYFTKRPSEEELQKEFEITHDDKTITAKEVASGRVTMIKFSEDMRSFVSAQNSSNVMLRIDLNPHESRTLHVAIESDRELNLHDNLQATDWKDEADSGHDLEQALSVSEIITPSGTINRGIYWAKVNTLRVLQKFKAGIAFTNDPPQDIIVVRDLAWFAMGCDYFMPEVSERLIDFSERYCFHPDGKLTEYVHAGEAKPGLNDYGLNINDDTPLFIIALEHHAKVSGNRDFAAKALRLSTRSADYIMTQMKDGLVYCDAEGVYLYGIASWRNIIDDYNLSGYVTEINIECCAALAATARIAAIVGDTQSVDKYGKAARELEANILSKLRTSDGSRFLLNIDKDGINHADVTGDLVFPALFGIGDQALKQRILDRIFMDDLWTEYGARTVASTDETYHPSAGMNLLGGVWPNLTTWFALAAKDSYPQRVAEAMEKIYAISESDAPADLGNVVPGEFPERLNGDSFRSEGMGMSPWMPPTYFLLGVEGLLGLGVDHGTVYVRPSLPGNWRFLLVLNVPIKGRFASFLVHDGTIYADMEISSELPVRQGKIEILERTEKIVVIKHSDKLGRRVFAFAWNSFSGSLSLHLNEHASCIDIELRENELKVIDIEDK